MHACTCESSAKSALIHALCQAIVPIRIESVIIFSWMVMARSRCFCTSSKRCCSICWYDWNTRRQPIRWYRQFICWAIGFTLTCGAVNYDQVTKCFAFRNLSLMGYVHTNSIMLTCVHYVKNAGICQNGPTSKRNHATLSFFMHYRNNCIIFPM